MVTGAGEEDDGEDEDEAESPVVALLESSLVLELESPVVVALLVLEVLVALLVAAFATATFWLLTDEPRAGSFPAAIWT